MLFGKMKKELGQLELPNGDRLSLEFYANHVLLRWYAKSSFSLLKLSAKFSIQSGYVLDTDELDDNDDSHIGDTTSSRWFRTELVSLSSTGTEMSVFAYDFTEADQAYLFAQKLQRLLDAAEELSTQVQSQQFFLNM